ncbi:MAG: Unknown protein [uncultured Campylobacterales bacterium]|uniref:Transporter n=1 Tax=uncultured Campylobacterales bacterium TaxID=352960 RepID=A0A6S6T3Y3_9BACT|nr:MAG: Unknown protein [uncultured Campylobacterales bacterium]
MKKIVLLSSVVAVLLSSDIREDKQRLYEFDVNQSKYDARALKMDVFEPIVLSWQKTSDNINGFDVDSEIYRAGINQSISLGTYYAVKYANKTRDISYTSIDIVKNSDELTKNSIVVNLLKIDLILKKQKLLIKNSEINIIQKTDSYKDGLIDISFLNDAIIAKNNLKIALEDLNLQKNLQIQELLKLSNKNYKQIELEELNEISFDEYIKDDLEYKLSTQTYDSLDYEKRVRFSRNLPSLNLGVSYSKNVSSDTEGTNYVVGASVPIGDFSLISQYQSAKVQKLKQKLILSELKRDKKIDFNTLELELQSLKNKIKISKENIKTYDELLKDISEKLSLGVSTSYDKDIIKNTFNISKIEKELLELDKKLVLFKINRWKL